ncbi:MAG: 16S rRNA (uracil(1498)-N(3))-methyltransferase [Pseudomonadota bacterium]
MVSKRTAREQRVFTPHPLQAGAPIACDAGQRNYLVNVLRLGEGATVLVFNGVDGEWRAALRIVSKKAAALEPLEQVRAQTGGPDITLLFAPLKRDRLDYVVQKATELGVRAIQPVVTTYTQAQRLKHERLVANVVEAAEQCGVLRLPEMRQVAPLREVVRALDGRHRLIFCDEGAAVTNPVAALADVALPATVLIGPEGGFSPEERDWLATRPGTTVLSLGPRILRADTAVVAALTLLNATAGDWH